MQPARKLLSLLVLLVMGTELTQSDVRDVDDSPPFGPNPSCLDHLSISQKERGNKGERRGQRVGGR
ncbi:hypothetical protein ACRRTK_024470 [Alexandromys fortis]